MIVRTVHTKRTYVRTTIVRTDCTYIRTYVRTYVRIACSFVLFDLSCTNSTSSSRFSRNRPSRAPFSFYDGSTYKRTYKGTYLPTYT